MSQNCHLRIRINQLWISFFFPSFPLSTLSNSWLFKCRVWYSCWPPNHIVDWLSGYSGVMGVGRRYLVAVLTSPRLSSSHPLFAWKSQYLTLFLRPTCLARANINYTHSGSHVNRLPGFLFLVTWRVNLLHYPATTNPPSAALRTSPSLSSASPRWA